MSGYCCTDETCQYCGGCGTVIQGLEWKTGIERLKLADYPGVLLASSDMHFAAGKIADTMSDFEHGRIDMDKTLAALTPHLQQLESDLETLRQFVRSSDGNRLE